MTHNQKKTPRLFDKKVTNALSSLAMLEPVPRYLPIMLSLFVTLLYHCKRICHQSLCKAALTRSSILSRLEVGVDQKRRGNNKTPEKIQQKTSPPKNRSAYRPAFSRSDPTTLAMYARFVHLPAAARLPLDSLSARPLVSHSRKAKQAGRNILLTVWTPPPLVTKLAEEKSSARPQRTPPPLERPAFLSSLFPFVPFSLVGERERKPPRR